MSDSTAPLGSIEVDKIHLGEEGEVTIGEDLDTQPKDDDDMIVNVPANDDYMDSHKRTGGKSSEAYGQQSDTQK